MQPPGLPCYAFLLPLPLVWLAALAYILLSRRKRTYAPTAKTYLGVCSLALGVAGLVLLVIAAALYLVPPGFADLATSRSPEDATRMLQEALDRYLLLGAFAILVPTPLAACFGVASLRTETKRWPAVVGMLFASVLAAVSLALYALMVAGMFFGQWP
jgi:ABC-type Na+ efflux pump permease subunit